MNAKEEGIKDKCRLYIDKQGGTKLAVHPEGEQCDIINE